MFSTKGVDTTEKRFISKYITYGNQELTVTNITVDTSANTGSKRAVFHMETPEITDKDFEGIDGAKGAVGRVRSSYMKNPEQFTEFTKNIGIIADKLGIRNKVDAIQSDNFDDYITKVSKLITGKTAYWSVTGEEYKKADGTIGINLAFRRYGFIASKEEGMGHLRPFDKESKYDYKRLTIADTDVIPNGTGTETDVWK